MRTSPQFLTILSAFLCFLTIDAIIVKQENSLFGPYQAGVGHLMYWDLTGSSQLAETSIRLTPDEPGKQGAIWSNYPMISNDWEFHVQFHIHGKGVHLNGDGIAFWYVRDPLHAGSVFGSKDYWSGLGIFIDTFENAATPHNHLHPYLSAVVNNGSFPYHHDEHGTAGQVGGCHLQARNLEWPAKIAISYISDVLTVYVDSQGNDNWAQCFRALGVHLPTGYSFGVSASTSEYSDNHDVVSITTLDNIIPDKIWEDRSHLIPNAEFLEIPHAEPKMKLLCYYGNPVSAIIHEKIATNSEYSHIECGKRKVYMNIFSDKKIPNKINFTYQDMFFRIDVMVEPPASDVCETLPVPEVTEEQIDEDSNDALEVASSINMKPDVEEVISKKKPSEKRAYHRRGKSKANSATNMASRLKRRARKGWYGTRNAMARNKFTPQNKDKLKLAVKKHLAAEGKRKLRKSEAVPKTEASSRNSAAEENPGSSNNVESKDAIDHFSANDISEYVTQYPLSTNELMEFMKKSKFHRDPCRIAWEFLKEKTPESIEALKIQLREYYQVIKDQGIKFRIRRVIASLKYSKDSVNE